MSRSNPKKTQKAGHVSIASNFPVDRCVKGCYLKKMELKQKMWGDIPYYRFQLYFLHEPSGSWITKYISDKPREAFSSDEKYNENKLKVAANIENLMACYLSGDHIKHIMFQTNVSGIVDKVSEIQEALKNKRFWDTEVHLKTLPNSEGGVRVAEYAPYMNLPSGTAWTLSYNNWEKKRLIN